MEKSFGYFHIIIVRLGICICFLLLLFLLSFTAPEHGNSLKTRYTELKTSKTGYGVFLSLKQTACKGKIFLFSDNSVSSGQNEFSSSLLSSINSNEDLSSKDIQNDESSQALGGEKVLAAVNAAGDDYILTSAPHKVLNSIQITSLYGQREDPLDQENAFHTGIDLAAADGDEIFAAYGGTVTLAEESGGYGKVVVIEHSEGFVTRYAHCSKLLVKEGQKVKSGEKIALAGSSGRTTGSHLHFEALSFGKFVDPYEIIRQAS